MGGYSGQSSFDAMEIKGLLSPWEEMCPKCHIVSGRVITSPPLQIKAMAERDHHLYLPEARVPLFFFNEGIISTWDSI